MTVPGHFKIQDYKSDRLKELEEVVKRLCSTFELRKILDENWIIKVRTTICSMGPDCGYSDQAYHLFRILRDENSILEKLDQSIVSVGELARKDKRNRYFRETIKKLQSREANQIQAAIFEILILARLVRLCETSELKIQLYPRIPSSEIIEVRVCVHDQWCNFEAKALGFSHHDVGMNKEGNRVGSHSVDSMVCQIKDALRDKERQLSGTEGANIVCLALGLNADKHSAPWGIKEFFNSFKGPNLSAVLLRGSFLGNKGLGIFSNEKSKRPLTRMGENFLKKLNAM